MKSRFIFFILLVFGAFKGFTQPHAIHLSWNKNSTAHTMGVTWLSGKDAGPSIQFGTDSLKLAFTKKGSTSFSADLQEYATRVTLDGLMPSSTYFYRVGSRRFGWSKVYRFKTAPASGTKKKFVVGVWSDTQNNEGNFNFEQTDTIVQRYGGHEMDFMIETGDIVENGSVVESWKKYFNTAQPLLARYPFMSVTGNHDVVNDSSFSSFQKPFPVYYHLFNLPGDQLNYSFDYGNVHFVAINSGWAQGAEKTGKVLFAPGSEEYRWLEADLAKASKDPRTGWIILYCHYPIYSFGWSHVATWAENLIPLIDSYQVDLVLSGHRHVYERHTAMREKQVLPMGTDKHLYHQPKGTVYITSGSSGGSLQGLGGSKLPDMVFTPNEKIYTYGVMAIEGNTLAFDLYSKDGRKIDYFTIKKPSSTTKNF